MQQHSKQKTAILIFVRSQLEEVRSKKWYSGAGYQNDLKLTALLNRQVLSVAKASRLPTFVISGKDQVGNSFGERFTHAIQSIFRGGFQNVIALGNDCLQLQTKDILIAHSALESHSLVIGPAADGGAYLIGVKKDTFDSVAFCNLSWQATSLLGSIKMMAAEKKTDIIWLAEQKDLDSVSDLRSILKELQCQNILTLLLPIIGYFQQKLVALISICDIRSFQLPYPHRGPPM